MWTGMNKLTLNPNKREFILIGDDIIRDSVKSSLPVISPSLSNIMEPTATTVMCFFRLQVKSHFKMSLSCF